MFKLFSLLVIVVAIGGCSSTSSSVDQSSTGAQELCSNLNDEIGDSYGNWSAMNIDDVEICLPHNHSIIHMRNTYTFGKWERRRWTDEKGYFEIFVPGRESIAWNDPLLATGAMLRFIVINTGEIVDQNLKKWVENEFGGSWESSAKCSTHGKMKSDYSESNAINILWKSSNDEILMFESCTMVGKWYAVDVDGNVVLISDGFNYFEEKQEDISVLRSIISSMRYVDSSLPPQLKSNNNP